jgi:hypothetical protein
MLSATDTDGIIIQYLNGIITVGEPRSAMLISSYASFGPFLAIISAWRLNTTREDTTHAVT